MKCDWTFGCEKHKRDKWWTLNRVWTFNRLLSKPKKIDTDISLPLNIHNWKEWIFNGIDIPVLIF